MTAPEQLAAAVEALRLRLRVEPRVGLILGSGLGHLAGEVADPDVISYTEIPGFQLSTAPGHAGRLVVGRLEGLGVAALQGRHHLYEGYSPAEVAYPVRLLAALGCRVLIVTNAAGGLDPAHAVGDFMLIEDHLFLPGMVGLSPLRGLTRSEFGVPFVDVNDAYDPALRALAVEVARQRNITLHRGVYAMVAGPHFETRAEVRALRRLGADAVGMSTCPEVVAARQCGLRVLGISCITNLATGEPGTTVDHEAVLRAGEAAAPRFRALVKAILAQLEKDL